MCAQRTIKITLMAWSLFVQTNFYLNIDLEAMGSILPSTITCLKFDEDVLQFLTSFPGFTAPELNAHMHFVTSLTVKFFFTSLQPLNKIRRNFSRIKYSTSMKFLFFEPILRQRRPPRLLIGRDIFDFSTAKQNLTKVDRKQVLKIPC